MDYTIREMRTDEYHLLNDFLYQAIYQPDKTNLAPKSIINKPELQVYIKDFGKQKDDYCFCAEANGKIVGAVWVRNINGYGSIDNVTVEFAISVFDKYQKMGIGTALMNRMLEHLKELDYPKASLAVQKKNYAVRMYQKVGFDIIDENRQEYIMIHRLGNENDK
ncbi:MULTISPECIES: GNAT family N-acetyltransferase [unclassified Ruminococcus]|uniref:GNAT family N-acetyltransferase n=1 Tax=unclassified Ruminococcus TaxID=2608920 RepID=UPI00210E5AF3|nr:MULTISPECIES: GNAT family N-acetyltransferase [unclassified Ruminococcus]MCQ4021766.1 GNAT family N-acetyltransferase [Ruminococcus sp. zg-924]MCQ4114210.1 GNAT family N-acetyltransferase [Ruminococcus sp. zg-921]